MTAPRLCEDCGAALDAGETCDCKATVAPNGTMEFVMGDSLDNLPKTIDFNFEELKTQLADRLTTYSNIIVTEDTIRDAKADRAKLNKLRAALEDQRRTVKRECMRPYADFECKVKELVSLIDQPINAIDGQLKSYEEQRRAVKRAAVQAIYDDVIGELRNLLTFDMIWQDSWYNVGSSLKKIQESISRLKERVLSDLETLKTVDSEFSEAVRLKYLETMDIGAALKERDRLQQKAKQLREYEAQCAEWAAAREEQAKAKIEEQAAAQVSDTATSAFPTEAEEEKIYLLRFSCMVTKEQAAALSAWLRAQKIEYRRI